MKIEKVNDHQIRCTLTREDLVSRELKISELAYGTAKAKDLFRDMMQQAALEFDFEADDIPLMIEAIPLNSECIVLIVTKVEDPEELDTRFAKFAPSVNHDEDEEESEDISDVSAISDEVMDLFEKISKVAPQQQPPAAPVSEDDTSNEKCQRIFGFSSMNELTALARILGSGLDCINSVYKDDIHKQYLLVVKQQHLSNSSFGKICNTISEYGRTLKAVGGSAYMDEHFTILLENDALQRLSEI